MSSVRKCFLAAFALLVCSCRGGEAPGHSAPVVRSPSVQEDLRFNDPRLQSIARSLLADARLRHMDVPAKGNRVERLIALEAALGANPRALECVNAEAIRAAAADNGEWARLRSAMRREFDAVDGLTAVRVCSLVDDWQRERTRLVIEGLSAGTVPVSDGREWEARFHGLIRSRPVHAATWAWIVARARRAEVARQFGHADAESAYRFYLSSIRADPDPEVHDLFRIPGIRIE